MSPSQTMNLTLKQLQAAGRLVAKPMGLLSPLQVVKETPLHHLTSPTIVDLNGDLLPEVTPALVTLVNPSAITTLTVLTPELILDLLAAYPPNLKNGLTVLLTNRMDEVLMESPAPLARVIFDLLRIFSPYESETQLSFEANLSLVGGWVLFAVLDLLRQPTPQAITVASIIGQMKAPMQALTNLSAYLRERLDLSYPTKSEVITALEELISKQIMIFQNEKDLTPGEGLKVMVEDMVIIRTHCHLQHKHLKNDVILQQDHFFLQGASGNGLLWHEAEGEIEIRSISVPNFLQLAEVLFVDIFAA